MNKNNISPFKFLDSYSIDDKDIFFGRDKESKDIYRKFFSKKLLVLYGKSGTGKSSLINCGLMANIPSEDALLIQVRCGDDPFNNMIDVLRSHAVRKSNDEIKLIEDIYENHFKPLAFVFDQFEEVFIIASNHKRKKFIKALNNILTYNKVKKNVILVIREEYLASLTDIENEIPDLFDNRIRLQNIKKENYKDIIEKPCRRKGVKIEAGLANEIITKIDSDIGEIELTYFQVLMDNLYKKAEAKNSKSPILTKADFKEMGNIDNILGDFLNYELTQINDIARVEAILKVMVTHEGTKNPISTKDISRLTSISEEKVKEIIRDFISKRIIREKNEKGQYELMHDSLAKRIFDRMSEDEKKATEVKQLIIARYKDYKNTKNYLDKETLEFIQPYLKHIVIDKRYILFIKKSQDKIYDKGNNKLFTIVIIIVIPLIIAGILLIRNMNGKEREISSLHSKISALEKVQNEKQLKRMASEYVSVKGGTLYFQVQPGDSIADSSMVIQISDFEICKHEVSVEEYHLYCSETNKKLPSQPSWGWSDQYPIVNINWNNAKDYCSWLSRITGHTYRMPTEAEYEFAAKGGRKSENYFYSGGNNTYAVAVFNTSSPSIIQSRKPNELGIYDLSGNVREWCQDWYSEDISPHDVSDSDYLGPSSASDERNLKVVRGGAYSSGENTLEVTARYYGRIDAVTDEEGNGLEHFGFRCIRIK